MTEEHEFPHLLAAAAGLGASRDLSLLQLRALICHDCDFWHDEHEEELECSGFRILRLLLARGVLTPATLAQAVHPFGPDEGSE